MDDLVREFLIESQEGLDRMERSLTELEAQPGDPALVAEIFRSVHTIKGTTGFLGFPRLEKLAHAGENLLGLVREGTVAASPRVITTLLGLLDGLRAILGAIEADGSEGEGSDAALIAVLEELQTAATETAQTHLPTQEAQPRPDTAQGSAAAESTLRVDVALLNRLMNLVGELVLTRNQVLQATAGDVRMVQLSRRLDMVTADLREAVMKARMQPVSHLFSKMPRVVRDLGQLLGRRVRLEMEGQQTELDKSLLEAIKDPLTHAVRNALDHGIETPTVREAAGKNPEGTLTLRALQEGSHVLVEIADDGAGIPIEKVRAKAVERGLITAQRAAELSERESLQLIFLPGFSTAAAVTTVSGRGVGMDVVRTNVEKIGGQVEIESRVGHGTKIRLRVPLTLAIIPALIMRSGGQSFALPQGALSELVRVTRADTARLPDSETARDSDTTRLIEWIGDAPVFRLRGQLLPLVFLDHLLGLDRFSTKATYSVNGKSSTNDKFAAGQCDCFIVVLDVDGRRFGLVVDGLADPEEIVVKPLSAALRGIGLYIGATILGNGGLALILDPAAVAMRARIAHNVEERTATIEMHLPETEQEPEYLPVEAGGRCVALPLRNVLRIESPRRSRIEWLGARPLLRAGGEVLQIEDIGGILPGDDSDAPLIIVICAEGARQFGVLVSRVLDIARGSALIEAGTASRAEGVILLGDRVASILRSEGLGAGISVLCVSPEEAEVKQ